MKTLPALASLLSILACALWIAALAGPWYHAQNKDGTEQHMGLFGSYHKGSPNAFVEDKMAITVVHEKLRKHHGDHERTTSKDHDRGYLHHEAEDDEEPPAGTPTPASPSSPAAAPTGSQPTSSPGATASPTPISIPEPHPSKHGRARHGPPRHQHAYGESQRQKQQQEEIQSNAPGATGQTGDNPPQLPPAATPPPGYGHGHGHPPAGNMIEKTNGNERKLQHAEVTRDANTFPYDEPWVTALKVLLILAVVVSGISALLQLLMAWTVGRHLHKGSWTTSPTTAIITTTLIALAGIHGLVSIFLFLSKRDQLPHGHFDYGYTLNIVATALSLLSPLLFWYSLDTGKYESLLGEETITGRRKYASVE